MKKYRVLRFPSYLGTPKEFRFKWMAFLYARYLQVTRIAEIRIIDPKGNHTVL